MDKKAYLDNLREDARARGIPTLLPVSAKKLQKIVSEARPNRILEVGAAVGYSASLMLLSCEENATIVTMEIDEERYLEAKNTFETLDISDRVTIYLGDACEIVPNMSGRFDLIFLDGPKSRYADFYPFLKRMLEPQGVLIADNVLFRDTIVKEGKTNHSIRTIITNMRRFISLVQNDEDMTSEIIDVGDGFLVAKRSK